MGLHNLPTGVRLDHPYASMRVKESPSGPFETEPSQPAQPFNSTWTNPFEAVTAEEHDTRAIDSPEGEIEERQATAPDEQPSVDDDLFLPLDDRIQSFYDTYHTSYAFPISETSAHMQHAKDLALALLQRHYPESQGYLVESAAPGPYSAKGINSILKESNESDSDPDTPPPKKQKRSARRTNTRYSFDATWHHIEPDNMTAFVVRKGALDMPEGVETLTYHTHTCLVIILDGLSTFQRWSRANINHRGDVLSDLLGVMGGIEKGHGMLFFGPRLELYNYDASDDSQPVKPFQSQDWRMDMRTTSLAAVDEMLSGFAGQEVFYKDAL